MALKSLLIFALIASCFLDLGHLMTIETSPDKITATITKSATVSCVPDDVGGDVDSVESIEINKDGDKLVALVRPCQKADCTLTSSSDIQAEGAVGINPSKSFLKVTITDPAVNDTGVYSCNMKYLDKTSLIKEDKDEKNLTVEEMTADALEPLLDNLTKRVEMLEAQAGSPMTTAGPGGSQNPACIAAFAVTNKKPYTAVRSRNLILPDALTVKGAAYDIKTGVFTAPCSGLYTFHLTVALAQKMSGTIVQVKKNSDVLFRIYAADRTYDDQASASSVVFLDAGDTVVAFVEAVTGSRTYDSKGYTIFSGYLTMQIE